MLICHQPRCYSVLCLLLFFICGIAHGEDLDKPGYTVNPGDTLSIYVWNEQSLSVPEVLVTPDGFISVPMAGAVKAGGHTIDAITAEIADKLYRYLRDKPTVTVSIMSLQGNIVSILGKVNRPGQYVMRGITDVTQALALAGGLTPFANENSIKILRRNMAGHQEAIEFRYGKIADGKNLEENLLLYSGDVVVVP